VVCEVVYLIVRQKILVLDINKNENGVKIPSYSPITNYFTFIANAIHCNILVSDIFHAKTLYDAEIHNFVDLPR